MKIKIAFTSLILASTLTILFLSCNKEVSTTQPHETGTGKIIVNTNPQGAQIFLNGENTGLVTPDSLVDLNPGEYLLTLRIEPLLDYHVSINLLGNQRTLINYDFYLDSRNYGNLRCSAGSDNALIFLNDSCTNQYTPYTFYNLWPDEYKLKFTCHEHRADSTTVMVYADSLVEINLFLQDTSLSADYSSYNSDFPDVYATCIEVDRNDSKWIGTNSKGLVIHDDKTWIIYNTTNSEIPANHINWIAVDILNRKWIGTNNGLVIIDNNGTWSVYNCSNSSIPYDFINAIAFDSQGNAWIGATDAINKKLLIKYDGGSWTSFEIDRLIVSLAVDNDDNIWIGCDPGIKLFNGIDWIDTLNPPSVIIENPVETMAVSADGTVWIGVGTTTYQQGGLYFYKNRVFGEFEFAEKKITHIHIAENGNIWISLKGKYPYGTGGVPLTQYALAKIDINNNITPYTSWDLQIPTYLYMWSSTQSNRDLWIASRDKGIIKVKGGNL